MLPAMFGRNRWERENSVLRNRLWVASFRAHEMTVEMTRSSDIHFSFSLSKLKMCLAVWNFISSESFRWSCWRWWWLWRCGVQGVRFGVFGAGVAFFGMNFGEFSNVRPAGAFRHFNIHGGRGRGLRHLAIGPDGPVACQAWFWSRGASNELLSCTSTSSFEQ